MSHANITADGFILKGENSPTSQADLTVSNIKYPQAEGQIITSEMSTYLFLLCLYFCARVILKVKEIITGHLFYFIACRKKNIIVE